MRISDWSSDVCSSDLTGRGDAGRLARRDPAGRRAGAVRAAAGLPHGPLRAERHSSRRWLQRLHAVDQPARRRHQRREVLLGGVRDPIQQRPRRSEEHTSELQSLMRISYAVFCLKKKKTKIKHSKKETK